MRYLHEYDLVELTVTELAAGPAALGFSAGALAPADLFGAPDGAAYERGIISVPDETRGTLEVAIAALADPARVSEIHIAVADESLRRITLVPTVDGRRAMLARTGDSYRLGLQTPEEIALMVRQSLGESGPLAPADSGADMGTKATLAFLAILDALRLARLESLVAHTEARPSVALDEIAAILDDSGAEDFRWPLCFLDKVLPIPVAEMLPSADLDAALAELSESGLVDLVEAEDGLPAIVAPQGWAEVAADVALHDISKLAASVAVATPGGVEIQSLLAIRSARGLFVAVLSPEGSTLSLVGTDALAELVAALI